jgi:hypothetical protein
VGNSEVHDEWCDRNGCRCGNCPCSGFSDCQPTPEQRKAMAWLAGTLAGVHDAVKVLERGGVQGLDPVACAMEDMGDLLLSLVTGATGPESMVNL